MLINGMKVFSLHKIDSSLASYYITATGDVISTKREVPYTLSGSSASGSSIRYYTLGGRSWRSDVLLNCSKSHTDFAVDVGLVANQTKPEQPRSSDRSHASTLQEGLDGRGWVIASVDKIDGEDHLVFGSKPKIHLTPTSVESELKRLATQKPGVKFVGLQIVKTLVAGGLIWG